MIELAIHFSPRSYISPRLDPTGSQTLVIEESEAGVVDGKKEGKKGWKESRVERMSLKDGAGAERGKKKTWTVRR